MSSEHGDNFIVTKRDNRYFGGIVDQFIEKQSGVPGCNIWKQQVMSSIKNALMYRAEAIKASAGVEGQGVSARWTEAADNIDAAIELFAKAISNKKSASDTAQHRGWEKNEIGSYAQNAEHALKDANKLVQQATALAKQAESESASHKKKITSASVHSTVLSLDTSESKEQNVQPTVPTSDLLASLENQLTDYSARTNDPKAPGYKIWKRGASQIEAAIKYTKQAIELRPQNNQKSEKFLEAAHKASGAAEEFAQAAHSKKSAADACATGRSQDAQRHSREANAALERAQKAAAQLQKP